MLAVDHSKVPLDELLPLLAHFVSLASKLGRLASVWDAADHLALRALDRIVLNLILFEEGGKLSLLGPGLPHYLARLSV